MALFGPGLRASSSDRGTIRAFSVIKDAVTWEPSGADERLSIFQSSVTWLSFACVILLFSLLVLHPRRESGSSSANEGAARVSRSAHSSSSDDSATNEEDAEEAAAAAQVPLVMLVNVKSGGGAGGPLMAMLARRVRHPPEVFPLSRDGVNDAVRRLIHLRSQGLQPRLVSAGGDGTVTALVRTLLDRGLSSVPVAILPLGTGNDMGRTLGMFPPGPQLTDPHALGDWLHRVRRARSVPLDVFEVSFDTYEGGSVVCVRDKVETQLAERAVRGTACMYLSIGLDARLVYTAELHRRRNRMLNKLNYALAGAYNIFNALGRRPSISTMMSSLHVDGLPIAPEDMPCVMQSLICLLIPSYGGGAPLWRCAWPAWPDAYRKMYASAFLPPATISNGAAQLSDADSGTGSASGSPVTINRHVLDGAQRSSAPDSAETADNPTNSIFSRIPVPAVLLQPIHLSIRGFLSGTAVGKLLQQGALHDIRPGTNHPASADVFDDVRPHSARHHHHLGDVITQHQRQGPTSTGAAPSVSKPSHHFFDDGSSSDSEASYSGHSAGCMARYRRRLRRLFQRLLRTPADPYPLPLTSPTAPSSATGTGAGNRAASGGVHPLRQLSLSMGVGLGAVDAWPSQSLDDGHFELVGVRSLFQLSGVVGPKTPLLCGVYRLGQPSSVAMTFTCPERKGFSSDVSTPMVALEVRPQVPVSQPSAHLRQQLAGAEEGPSIAAKGGKYVHETHHRNNSRPSHPPSDVIAVSDGSFDAPNHHPSLSETAHGQALCAQGEGQSMHLGVAGGAGDGSAFPDGPLSSDGTGRSSLPDFGDGVQPTSSSASDTASGGVSSILRSPSAAAVALGRAVKRTARRIQTHRRRHKAAVLAPPETVDEVDYEMEYEANTSDDAADERFGSASAGHSARDSVSVMQRHTGGDFSILSSGDGTGRYAEGAGVATTLSFDSDGSADLTVSAGIRPASFSIVNSGPAGPPSVASLSALPLPKHAGSIAHHHRPGAQSLAAANGSGSESVYLRGGYHHYASSSGPAIPPIRSESSGPHHHHGQSQQFRGYAIVPHGSIASSVGDVSGFVSTTSSRALFGASSSSSSSSNGTFSEGVADSDGTLTVSGSGTAAVSTTSASSTSSSRFGGFFSKFASPMASRRSAARSTDNDAVSLVPQLTDVRTSSPSPPASPSAATVFRAGLMSAPPHSPSASAASTRDVTSVPAAAPIAASPQSPSSPSSASAEAAPLTSPSGVVNRTVGIRHRGALGANTGTSASGTTERIVSFSADTAIDNKSFSMKQQAYASGTPSKALKPLLQGRQPSSSSLSSGSDGSVGTATKRAPRTTRPGPAAPSQPALAAAPPSAPLPPIRVPMGGVFADSDPIFLQVDGEGYKVFALRSLEIKFRARARLVTFN